MSVVVNRMQDLAYEFSKKNSGVIPRTPTAEGGDLSRTHPQLGLWPGAGRKRPGVEIQTSVLLNFSAVVAPLTPQLYIGR